MILVTGGAGFVRRSVGRWLALGERPHTIFRGRINDPVALREPMQGVDTIIHLASAERRGSNRALRYTDIQGMATLENDQEKLTGELKLKTAALNAQASLARKKLADARKRVKLTVPQAQWVDFGIEATK